VPRPAPSAFFLFSKSGGADVAQHSPLPARHHQGWLIHGYPSIRRGRAFRLHVYVMTSADPSLAHVARRHRPVPRALAGAPVACALLQPQRVERHGAVLAHVEVALPLLKFQGLS